MQRFSSIMELRASSRTEMMAICNGSCPERVNHLSKKWPNRNRPCGRMTEVRDDVICVQSCPGIECSNHSSLPAADSPQIDDEWIPVIVKLVWDCRAPGPSCRVSRTHNASHYVIQKRFVCSKLYKSSLKDTVSP